MRLQSGLISNPSLGKRFQTEWTSFLAATPASHLAQPGNDLAQKTQDTSGLLSQMELESCDPNFVFLKTSKDTSLLDSEKSLENWNQWVIKCRGEYSQRVKLAHLIRENESSSWPTAKARDWKDTTTCSLDATNPDGSHRNRRDRLVGMIAAEMASGPVARDNPSMDGNRPESWATPTARDHKSGKGKEDRTYSELTPMIERQAAGRLNPRWVETLMGLPVGWVMPDCASPVTIEPTNCDYSETESFQLPQPELF